MNRRLRVLCLISGMTAGGAERVMAHLTSYLSVRHDVRLVTFEAPGTPAFYTLAPSVEVVQLDLLNKQGLVKRILSILTRFRAIRRQLKKFRPDVVLSFMDTTNIVATIVCRASGVPVVISERTDPTRHRIGRTRSLARRLVYPFADRCVVQTERVRRYFSGALQPALAVIPNAVPRPPQQAAPAAAGASGRFRIIAMGRLDPSKGYDLLLEAFARVAPAYPDWDLVIFGEGICRRALEARIQALGLTARAFLPGLTREPGRELAGSHIMAFPSRYEGFPNALAEGLAAGLPAIAYAGVSGVEELIVDKTGFLVDPMQESAGFAAALSRLMDDPDLRARLGAEARRHVETWSPEVVCRRWELLLAAVAEKE